MQQSPPGPLPPVATADHPFDLLSTADPATYPEHARTWTAAALDHPRLDGGHPMHVDRQPRQLHVLGTARQIVRAQPHQRRRIHLLQTARLGLGLRQTARGRRQLPRRSYKRLPASTRSPPLASAVTRATSPSGSLLQPHGSVVPLSSAVATSVTSCVWAASLRAQLTPCALSISSRRRRRRIRIDMPQPRARAKESP